MTAVFIEAIESKWGVLPIRRAYATLDEKDPQKRSWQIAYEAGWRHAITAAEAASERVTYQATPLADRSFFARVTPAGWVVGGAVAVLVARKLLR